MTEVFNPLDPRVREDPFPLYQAARHANPVLRHDGLGVWSVFRYHDIVAVLEDHAAWSSSFPAPPPGVSLERDLLPSMLAQDPPEHTRLRGLVAQAFTPRMVRQVESRTAQIAHELVDAALRQRQVDLVEAYTYPLPVIVIAEILGVPAEDRADFKRWCDVLVKRWSETLVRRWVASLASNLGLPVDSLLSSEEETEHDLDAVDELRAYFSRLINLRRVQPRDDLVSALVAAELDGSRLTFDELLQLLAFLLVAGNETTTNLIGNTAIELMRRPDTLARLRAHPELLPGAVEEGARFSSPVQAVVRRATRSVEIAGRCVGEGEQAVLWLGSGNRDEAVFENAETFDIGRNPKRHLGFGSGIHFCLGASLGRLEARVALGALLQRTRSVRRTDDEPLPRLPTFILRGVQRLPVVLDPAV